MSLFLHNGKESGSAILCPETLWDPEPKERELVYLVEKIKYRSDQAAVWYSCCHL